MRQQIHAAAQPARLQRLRLAQEGAQAVAGIIGISIIG